MSDLSRFSLNGRVAVVTGAGSGLGRAIAEGLADAGALLGCIDIEPTGNEATANSIGAEAALAVTADVRTPAALDAAATTIEERFGTPQILVNSAGIGGRGPADHYPDERWVEVLDVNLKGSFNACRTFGRAMIETGGGSIVNIASIGGLVGFAGSVGYQASKGGVIQMTRTLAVEWAPAGVRVNAIAPGHIATTLVMKQWETEPELKEFFLDRTPMGRLGTPDDVVGAVVFLASDAASMVTGQTLAIDGGYTAQ